MRVATKPADKIGFYLFPNDMVAQAVTDKNGRHDFFLPVPMSEKTSVRVTRRSMLACLARH